MIDLLISGGVVITLDPARRIIDHGAVAVEAGRIIAVGETGDLADRYQASRTIDASRKIILPGLIDAHAHAGHGLIKTLGADNHEKWYGACEQIYTRGSTAAFWRAEARLSALERLKCGTTFGVSYLGGGESFMATDAPEFGDAYCEAVEEIGIRAMLAVGPGAPPFPRPYLRWDQGKPQERSITHAIMLATCETLLEKRHDSANGRLQVCLCFPTPKPGQYTPGTPAFNDLIARAEETRFLGRKYGALWTMDGHQQGTIDFTHTYLNVLGPDAFLSHCVDITPVEIEILRETGTSVVHNPSAVFSIEGRCPVPELLDAGVTVMIGSDGAAPDRGYDLFRHMWQCMHYHRRHFRDPAVLPPGKALEMITIDAARGLGVAAELGSLEVGKRADMILIDLDKPHLYPLQMPAYRLVYYASGNDVDTVIVDGRVLMENRQVLTVNEQEILTDAQGEIELALDRTGLWAYTEMPDTFWRKSHY